MNQVKTTALLTLMSLVVLFTAQTLGYNLIFSIVLAGIFNFLIYFYSGKIALSSTKATEIGDGEYEEVRGIVKYLIQKEKMPMPRLYIIQNDQPNAFATGRNPKNASIAVTTGILKVLNNDELEGVLAHEISHIKNRDILVSSIAAMLASTISFMSRSVLWGGGNRNRNTHPLFFIIALIAAPLASIIIRMAISRTREFGADRTGSEISGNPLALASALEKIEAYAKLPMNINPAVSQLFISDPLKALSGGGMRKLFSTHPPTAERVRRLREDASGIRYG
ncbi:zinc metalloprotease HtpX [Acidimicrobiaceae bacterium]|nr:zinc metalloprotease HtpX [Acidimicrobiaceae bacterium]MDA9859789.1 zinc metalloprotease HtpX [Acidimicrobiia bacterium]MDA9863114.1 zinc metalloprotease HtpX [Acidimicrobiia bacterium]MDB2456103.1 zinc metalloprotease HtpX [Candidatus Actinomarina sp.]MDB4832902.1 zinc metalloprotease HtpX [Acidimicrobiia bacterium]